MIQEGQVVLFEFPQTDQKTGKLRPAIVLRLNGWLAHNEQLEYDDPLSDEVGPPLL